MSIIDFIRKYPEIKERNNKYYLYQGIVYGLSAKEIIEIINYCLDQEIFKRKILLNKIMTSAPKWSKEDNEKIFLKVYSLSDSLSSYFKKESAAMIMMVLFPHLSRNNQNKLAMNFLKSRYSNNRKRIYKYFYYNWSPNCKKIVAKAWNDFRDEGAIGLIISKMPREFLLENFETLSKYFEENLDYDFYLRLLRNKLYARLYGDIQTEIEKIKKSDPISFIAIKKERGEKLDVSWAIEVYRMNSQSRFLARWYSDMGLWKDILREEPDFLSEIK